MFYVDLSQDDSVCKKLEKLNHKLHYTQTSLRKLYTHTSLINMISAPVGMCVARRTAAGYWTSRCCLRCTDQPVSHRPRRRKLLSVRPEIVHGKGAESEYPRRTHV